MNNKDVAGSGSLFALPSFWSGAARVLDLGGTFDVYKTAASGALADQEALAGDWLAVGRDMEQAMQAGK